ncbi:MAG: DUF3488 and transglutaminase-like domain-containing protein [Pseudomonadales bacterium]|nr:DUF3488 and transglutaminase-like domain-containing protein [Pseudomonadales bacterium]
MSHAIYPIPRNSLIWLLVSVSLALLPHFTRLPEWMWGVALAALLWRIQVFRERWRFPNKWLRVAFVFGGAAAIFYFYGTLLGPEAGVALLTLAYTFKLLEMYRERDAYLIVILSYFVIATNYLFERGLFSTLYSLFVAVVITASLVGLNQSRFNSDFKKTFVLAGRMMLHSVPLMLVLFVLVPRISPLWSMNLDNNKAKTGISDRMTPGDISELSKSSELAFRAEILSGPVPKEQDMYWRGAVFSIFDGRTWSVDRELFAAKRDIWHGIQLPNEKSSDETFESRIHYKVFLEPTNQEWVFALPFAEVRHRDLSMSFNLTWSREERITNSLSYEAISYPDYSNQVNQVDFIERELNKQLPSSGDIRSRAWAIKQYRRLEEDPEKFIEFLFRHFNQEPFSYTLRPTPLQINTIDQFMFTTRNGFCTHYAGAFVFLLRSVGIPARMIGGYQGGDISDSGNYITVRQYSAHAWAEAWLPGKGWTRFDPTMAVAPERIFDGAEGLINDANFLADSPLSPYRMRNWPILASLRNSLEHLDYLWTKWVVGYNSSTQYEFLGRFMGRVTPEKIAYALALIGGGCVLIFAFLLIWERPRNKPDPMDRLYLKFCERLARKGFKREPKEAPFDFAKRVSEQLPQIANKVNRITALYVKSKYGVTASGTEINRNQGPNRDRLGSLYYELKQEIRSLKV